MYIEYGWVNQTMNKYIMTVQHNIGLGTDAEPGFNPCTAIVIAT